MYYRLFLFYKKTIFDKIWIRLFMGGTVMLLFSCSGLPYGTTGASRSARFYTPKHWQTPIVVNGKPAASAQSGLQTYPKYASANLPQKIERLSGKVAYATASGQNTRRDRSIEQPKEQMDGVASWYGPNFHGKKTANGEIYSQYGMTAAHKFLPLNSIVRVRNLQNGREAIVRINDRGPYVDNRIIDLSKSAAEKIDMVKQGTARVKLDIIQYPHNFDKKAGIKAYKQVVVQLAVFKNSKRAGYYKDELSRRYGKYNIFIDRPSYNSFHVVIGPYDRRNDAKSVGKNLGYDGINTLVRSYRK